MVDQLSVSSLDYAAKKKRTKRDVFLAEMAAIVPWAALEAVIEPHYPKLGAQGGRRSFPLIAMLRIYCLQQWYNLSDPGAEEALYDIQSMRAFAGLELGRDAIPDETTILNFRHLLERHDLTKAIFATVAEHLAAKGELLRGGTIVDATLIAASPSTKNAAQKRDPEMSQSKIDLPDLTAVPFGNSSDLRVGDFVIAIGNPFGLEGSATAGIISGLMRSDIGYDIYESFIQIDAAVNPGNSGGALVNLDGELIGINTAVGRQGAGSVGIAFAIPINMARRIGTQIYQHGRMQRGSLGLQTRDIPPAIAIERKLANRRGTLITAVAPDSPAARAGIKPGCIVLGINGEPVRNNSDYMAHFGSSAVGEEIAFQMLVENTIETVKLVVTDRVAEPKPALISKDVKGLGGLTVADIGPRSPLYGQVRGAVVKGAEPGSPASVSGLSPGDIIVAVDQMTISEASQIIDLTETDRPIERVKINRQGIPYILELRPQ